jgi:glycosyltransferase involved in cell wall biosynthesis
MTRKQIAIFDHIFQRGNPVGSCQRKTVRALARQHDVTVFATACDPEPGDGVRFVKVPALRRPIALLYVLYHAAALMRYLLFRLTRGGKFDLIQSSETFFCFADVYYVHFCNRAYLKLRPSPIRLTSLRGWANWLDHLVQATVEPIAFRSARAIVACSRGLARDIVREYPFCSDKIHVIPNSIDLDEMRCPADFARNAVRRQIGFANDDIVFAFIALGHFDRKGLPILIDAIACARQANIKLLVVGGRDTLLAPYRKRAEDMGVAAQVAFVGHQPDVRPLLWAADAFAFPSFYEAFSLVIFEAAAAGLPIIAPLINGVEEILTDGVNGYVIAHSADVVADALVKFSSLDPEQRLRMGAAAKRAVAPFSDDRFSEAWRALVPQLVEARGAARSPVMAEASDE